MNEAYFECYGNEKLMLDIRAEELGKSIALRLNIDKSAGITSKEDEQKIQDYFLKNYVEKGYVMHSFSGAVEDSIRENGLSSSKRIWDNYEIMNVAHIFEEKDVISPVGGYSHYSGGGMYVENNARDLYWHALSAPEWFKWFTSANHNKNSSSIGDSPYYLRNYKGCKQNVLDLCINAGLNEDEMMQVMSMFEKNWELLGTERMCVALIPKSVIGKDNIEEATIPDQSAMETIKTVLSDRRRQYKEHDGNVLKQLVSEKDMLIMVLPKSQGIFGEYEFNRETKEELYNPRLVLDMIYRGTIESGFELSQEKIDSIIETLRQIHNYNAEVENTIRQYNERVSEYFTKEEGIENIGDYQRTYTTIQRVYEEINKYGVNAYMIGGISSAIQAGIDLYRQNEDIDLMVEKQDLPQLIECLSNLGYMVQDKRANLTGNYIDSKGNFHPEDHELNANIDTLYMLQVGIFVFERKDGIVITNSYAYEEKEKAFIGTQKVMPEELFDLMYSSEEIEYKGTQVKCQSKEYTYLSKSKGTREKDKVDASIIEQYIGENEQKRIDRIKKLQKRVEEYRIMYDKDGNIVSSEKNIRKIWNIVVI